MSALTRERLTDFAGLIPARGTYGSKANVRNFKGGLTCLDADGRAMPGDTKANGALFAVGKSSATFNNLHGSDAGGAADAIDVEVEFGTFGWMSGADADAIAAKDVGKVCYVIDDQTVGLTDGGGTRCVAGIVTEVRNGRVYVAMGPHVIGSINYAAALAADLQDQIDAL